jgi:imidazolonepropionase
MATILTEIGELVTFDPELEGDYGIISDAAIEFEDGIVTWIGSSKEASLRDSESRFDLSGRAVVPAFVDSHTHLIFAGDRSAEFASRMAGVAYSAGGIRTTVEATRHASDDELRQLIKARIEESRSQGTATIEIKTGYGLTVEQETRLARIANEFTDEVTFLGAHVVPAEYEGNSDAYVDLVCGEMLDSVAPYVKWIDVFCETGAFTVEQSKRIMQAGIDRGLGAKIHAAQLQESSAIEMALELGAVSIDHGTFLKESDILTLAESETVLTLLPGADFSTKQPYPNARQLLDAGVTVALASNCNPGSSNTTSLAFCMALAVREMGMTPTEALWSATAGGGLALNRPELGVIRVGNPVKLLELNAPNHLHIAYRPGVNLARKIWD